MKCIWQMDGDNVKGFKCDFTPIDMLIVISGLRYITADIERHPKDRERAENMYNQIMLGRYSDEAEQTETQTLIDWKDEMWTEAREQIEKALAEKTEPRTDIHDLTDCDFCKDRNCKDCEGGKDEPQTDCGWK